MNKYIITASGIVIAAVLALGSTAAMSATPDSYRNPYGVPQGGILKLDKAPTRQQTEMICKNLAKSKNLSGSQLTSYLSTCETGG